MLTINNIINEMIFNKVVNQLNFSLTEYLINLISKNSINQINYYQMIFILFVSLIRNQR